MEQVSFRFRFNGVNEQINRKGYHSADQIDAIARDMIRTGIYATELYDKYNLRVHYSNIIQNTFRSGPGQRYLIKLIVEEQETPHPEFWKTEVGKNVSALLPFYKQTVSKPT